MQSTTIAMAYKGKIIQNKFTGQSIKFIKTAKETNGELLEMITTYKPFSKEPVSHYHPFQNEYFKVLEGELTVKKNGRVIFLKKGEPLHIEKNCVHSMWNSAASPAIVQWLVTPALQTENLFETGMGLAADNKTNEHGMPTLLQVALLAKRFNKELRLASPSYHVQRLLFGLLTPLAYVSGKKAVYKKYID